MSRPPMRPNARRLSAQERRTLWWGRFKGLLQLTLGLALVVGSAWGSRHVYGIFRTSPHLHVQTLTIEGNTHAKAEALKILAGPIEGIHVMDLQLGWATASVLRHPWIASASFDIELPDEVVLRVTERAPVALLMAGDLYYVDAEGRPFVKVRPGELVDLPVLTGLEDGDGLLRRDGGLGQLAIRHGLGLLTQLEAAGAGAFGPVSEVHISLEEGYSFFLSDGGAEVLLGFDDFEVKLERLQALTAREGVDLHKVGRINLDLDRAAVVTALPSRVIRR